MLEMLELHFSLDVNMFYELNDLSGFKCSALAKKKKSVKFSFKKC